MCSLLIVAAMQLLATTLDPGFSEYVERAKLASPHCGIKLYHWMTPKQRDELCAARRRNAAR